MSTRLMILRSAHTNDGVISVSNWAQPDADFASLINEGLLEALPHPEGSDRHYRTFQLTDAGWAAVAASPD